jgi:large subunit ribosomal protein L25
MKTIDITGEPRPDTGKALTRELRKQGLIPCTINTPEGAVHFIGNEKELNKVTHTPETYIIKLDVGGKQYEAVLAEAQYHVLHDNLLTMDFTQVFPTKPVQVELPVEIVGRSPGVAAGGKLVQKARKLRVLGMYPNLPERIKVDISELRLGRSIKAGDLRFPEFQVRNAADVAVVSVELTRQLRQEGPQPGAAPAKK